MPKITKREVDKLPIVPPGGKELFIWDNELRGFGIRVKPSGAKSYLVQYRNIAAQTRRMVLGAVGVLTPDEARGLARDRLAEVAKGSDPSVERHAARNAITVEELCDWYLDQAAKGRLLGRGGRTIKASTLAMDRSRITVHVKPLIGKRTVPSLTLDDLEDMQSKIAGGKTSKPRISGRGGLTTGGAAVAARTLGMMHAIFQHGTRGKQISINPAQGSRKIAGQRRKRRLTLDDLTALGIAMRNAEKKGTSKTALRAIRSLLLTGFRRMEILTLRPEWIDETPNGGFVNFPDTKTGAQIRPIGHAALVALRQGIETDSEWVFPSDRGNGHYVGIVKVLERVCKEAKLVDVSPHVLRHTFASLAGDLGFTKLTIAGLLGHASSGDTESYVHLDSALLTAANRISQLIAHKLDGVSSADIMSLYKKTRSKHRRI